MTIVSVSLCSHLTTWGRKLLPKHTRSFLKLNCWKDHKFATFDALNRQFIELD